MNKKIIIGIFGALAVLSVITLIFLNIKSKKNPGEHVETNTVVVAENFLDVQNIDQKEVRIVDGSDGSLYAATSDLEAPDLMFKKIDLPIYKVIWSPDKNKAVAIVWNIKASTVLPIAKAEKGAIANLLLNFQTKDIKELDPKANYLQWMADGTIRYAVTSDVLGETQEGTGFYEYDVSADQSKILKAFEDMYSEDDFYFYNDQVFQSINPTDVGASTLAVIDLNTGERKELESYQGHIDLTMLENNYLVVLASQSSVINPQSFVHITNFRIEDGERTEIGDRAIYVFNPRTKVLLRLDTASLKLVVQTQISEAPAEFTSFTYEEETGRIIFDTDSGLKIYNTKIQR